MKKKKVVYTLLTIGLLTGVGVGTAQYLGDSNEPDKEKPAVSEEAIIAEEHIGSEEVDTEKVEGKGGEEEAGEADVSEGEIVLDIDKGSEDVTSTTKKSEGESSQITISVPNSTVKPVKPSTNTGVAKESIVGSLEYLGTAKNGEHHFTYRVQNHSTHDVTLSFSTGQRFDYILRDSKGNKVGQHSEGMGYTMALGEEKLIPGDILFFDLYVNAEGLKQGKYELEAWLTTTNKDTYNQTQTFVVK